MPPIWSVESDDPNLAAVLERLVDIKKGNTLVRAGELGAVQWADCGGQTSQGRCFLRPEGPAQGTVPRPRGLQGGVWAALPDGWERTLTPPPPTPSSCSI